MKIILIEDDEYKAKQIISFLQSLDHTVELRKAFNSGMKAIINERFDLALLDMTIPSFEISPKHPTSRTREFGGRDILSEIERCELDLPAIVITQYRVFNDGELSIEKIDRGLSQEFPDFYFGIIYYNSSAMDWQDELLEKLERIPKKEK